MNTKPNRQKVEKLRLNVSIPKTLLEECDIYMENYSAYFTKCLERFIDGVHKKQMATESYTIHNTKYAKQKDLYDHDSTLPDNEESYEDVLKQFKAMRESKKKGV